MSKISIKKVKISQVMGLEELEFEPGKITFIRGKNGLGKTSVVRGMLSAIYGGNPIEIIRNGEDAAEIGIEFSNGLNIEKTVKRTGKGELSISDENGHAVPKPQTYLSNMMDLYSFNPISILTASKKERLSILLEAIPMKATKDDFRLAFNSWVDSEKFPAAVLDNHALFAIEYFQKMVYEKRTETNSEMKKTKNTNDKLKSTMPKGDVENVVEKIQELEKKQVIILREKLENYEKIVNEKSAAIDNNAKKHEAQINEIRKIWHNDDEEIRSDYDLKLKRHQENIQAQETPIQQELMQLREIGKNQAATLKQMEIIKENENDIEKLDKRSTQYTNSLNELEMLKSKFLKDIPIDGLDVMEGDIYYRNVEFDLLNTQQQLDIIAEIAKLRAGDVGFVLVDGFERLDTEHQQAFIQTFLSTDLQLLVTEVSDDEQLTINNE
jgi:DNA repair exonuclease SbcCD ATPase subunit